MATSQITLDSGRQVTVHTPDGLDKEQTRAFLLKEGILPSTAGLSPFLPSEEGSASAAQAIALGRSLAPIADKVLSGMASLFGGFGFEPGVDVGGAGRPQLERDQPGATMVGEAIPFLAGGAGFRGASAFAGGFEALQPGATPGSVGRAMAIAGLGQQAGKFVGQGLGRLAAGGGRLAQRGVQGFRQTRPPTELPSGIQTTVGKLRGSKAIEQAEASAARNPFTSRPFNRIDRNNQAVGREKVLKWLDQADAPNLEEGVARAHADAIEAMDDAIPRDLEIKIPESVSRFFKKLQRTSERGAFDFPDNATVTGDDLRVIISDLRAGATSSRAATRRNSRKALELLDQEVLQKTEGINQELWREGSTGYGKWVKLTNGRAISKVDPEIINPTTVLKNLERVTRPRLEPRAGSAPATLSWTT